MALLSFEGVTKRYRRGRLEVVVLDDVCLDIDTDDHVALLGERRSGKSTLLRIAAGIENPDAGIVRFAGRDLRTMSPLERTRLLRQKIGFVPSALDAWSGTRHGRVLDHVALPLLSDGWTSQDAAALARSVLERVGAAHCADLQQNDLSLGERTLVGIARGLVRDPQLLLVDDPAATSSPGEQDRIRDLLRSLGRDRDLTLVVASEDLSVLRGAGRVVSLSAGRLLTSEQAGAVLPFPDTAARRRSPAQ